MVNVCILAGSNYPDADDCTIKQDNGSFQVFDHSTKLVIAEGDNYVELVKWMKKNLQ